MKLYILYFKLCVDFNILKFLCTLYLTFIKRQLFGTELPPWLYYKNNVCHLFSKCLGLELFSLFFQQPFAIDAIVSSTFCQRKISFREVTNPWLQS